MHTDPQLLEQYGHDHGFGQDRRRAGERRTVVALGLTAAFMLVEIAAGLAYGSMALLADGLHMASHAAALAIAVLAYVYARRYAHDRRFTFGTGKIGSLAGFASAVLLVAFAIVMAFESIHRFVVPVAIVFDQAILVAVAGLLVNAVSAIILGTSESPDHDDADDHHDHNLRAAYLHVLADAVTSVLAIVALAAGKFYGLAWMDPLMGVVGALLISRWAWQLIGQTGRVLTDREAPAVVRDHVRAAIEGDADNRIADLHVWSIGPNAYSGIISVVTHDPRPPEHYKSLIPDHLHLVHLTVEVRRCSVRVR
ncbi:MAG: CDF family Co(II)/Ni(II) efflux transporter DmeF [Alphaproteobacteria bacterium]|nr:CDF family Co(II)/Ni(II) efflux transporter DmeF [Alphaproteobacteria bacterium]